MPNPRLIYLMPNYRIGGVQNVVYWMAESMKNDYEIIVIAKGQYLPREGINQISFSSYFEILKFLIFENFDVVHTHGMMSLFQPFCRAKKRFHHFHNKRCNEEGRLRYYLNNFIFRLFSVELLTVTKQNKFSKFVPNTVGNLEPVIKKKPYFLWAGRNDKQKNFDLFYKFMKHNKQYDAHVYGRGFDALNDLDNLKFLGEEDDIWLVGSPKLVVMTSLFEGFPLLILEAWSRGVIVVCTPFLHDKILLDGPVYITEDWSLNSLNNTVSKALNSDKWNFESIRKYYKENLSSEVVYNILKHIYTE